MEAKHEVGIRTRQMAASLAGSPQVQGLLAGGLAMAAEHASGVALNAAMAVGSAALAVLNAHAFRLAEENSKQFSDEVAQRLERLENERVDKHFLASDEFTALLIQALVRNARTYEREKVGFFADVFVNSVTVELSKVPYKEGFLQIVDELSVAHIRIFKRIYLVTGGSGDQEQPVAASAQQMAAEEGIDPLWVLAYCQHLERFGLVRDAAIGTVGYRPGAYVATDYGNKFAVFLMVGQP